MDYKKTIILTITVNDPIAFEHFLKAVDSNPKNEKGEMLMDKEGRAVATYEVKED